MREADPADAPAIARVERVASAAPWSEAAVRTALLAATTMAWVVADPVAGDPVAGHLLTCCVAEEAEILTLAVDPVVRRRGLARRLLATCEAAWRERGVRSAWLEVRIDNPPARALYAGRGWVDAGVRRRYYADGADAQVMRWSPSSSS